VSFAAITTHLSPFGNRFKSTAPIEAKILQRYAMMPAPAASVEEPPYREPGLCFYQGKFIRKVAAPDFAHGFSMTNSVSSHTGSGNSKV
jgi:hypothetical protein